VTASVTDAHLSDEWRHLGSLSDTAVTAVDSIDGQVVVGTARGVAWLAGGGWTSEIGLPPIRLLRAAPGGRLVAVADDGLLVRDGVGAWDWVLNCDAITEVLFLTAADGQPAVMVATENDGVLVGDPSLTRWTSSCAGLADVRVAGLAHLGTGESAAIVAATASGIYLTRDQGRTWRRVTTAPVAPVTSLVGGGDDGSVFALFTGLGLHRSADGATWSSIDLPGEDDHAPEFLTALPEQLAVVGWSGRITLVDYAQSSQQRTLPALSSTPCLDLGTDDDGVLLAGTPTGLQRLTSRGWIPASDGLSGGVAVLEASPDSGVALVHTPGAGLAWAGMLSVELEKINPPDYVFDVAVTDDGLVWTLGPGGVRAYDGHTWRAAPPLPLMVRRLFAVGPGLVGEAETGQLLVLTTGLDSDWRVAAGPPAAPHRLVGTTGLIFAVSAVKDGPDWRSTVWAADHRLSGWRPVLAASTPVPAPVARDGSQGLIVALGDRIVQIGSSGAVRPLSMIDPANPDGPATALDLAGQGSSIVALSSRGLHWSGDDGLTWHDLWAESVPIAIAHTRESIVVLTPDSQVWMTSSRTVTGRAMELNRMEKTDGPRKL
jgi:hypothetical protein